MNGYTYEDLKAALNVVEALRTQTEASDPRQIAQGDEVIIKGIETSKAYTLRALDIVEDLIRLSF